MYIWQQKITCMAIMPRHGRLRMYTLLLVLLLQNASAQTKCIKNDYLQLTKSYPRTTERIKLKFGKYVP